MAKNVIALSGESRGKSGTGDARALRREKKVPAIIYGGKNEPQGVAIPEKAFREAFNKGNFTSKLVDLTVDGKVIRVLPKAVQFDPISDQPIHADFLRLNKGEEVTVRVKVRFINADKSPGLKRGGVLNIVRRYVEFICDTDHIPENITVDLEGRQIGQSIHIDQVELPKHARPAIGDRNFTIATLTGRKAKDEEETAAAAPGAAAPAAAPAAS